MNGIMSVDIGHLLGGDGAGGFIPANEFKGYPRKYAGVFEQFQTSLKEGKSPLALSLAEEASIPGIKELAQKIKTKYQNVLVLGIGGSALGARAVLQFLKGPFYNMERRDEPRLFILDNLDPLLVAKLENIIDIKKTALIYTSKSGSTPETAAQFIYFYKKYREAGGDVKDIVIICDKADNGINHIARDLGCHLLHIPGDLPGRYSVLSSVGFLPSEIAGVDSARLMAGARAVHGSIIDNPPENNSLFALGTCLYELALKGKSIHVLFNYSSFLFEFGLWFVQLWAESLGKRLSGKGEAVNAGTTPLTSLGATDQHSILQLFKEGPADKVIGFARVEAFSGDIPLTGEFSKEKEYSYFAGHTMAEQLAIEQLSTEMSLVGTGTPCYRITVKDISPESLGALFYFYEALVVFTAGLWDINPYNQPGVEEGKNITYALMGREDYAGRRAEYEKQVEKYNNERIVFEI
ncbi:glucose-6-phosphate isomerase [Desulfocucumis palustris]|uniref:Glucose-6-phosphate isomerase n=1 Tax=Desulfocucumis palustris TaxID=1898651 RepID=A0A2L2XGN5_9FIRM|nr:glucose-6-phosphate isomerase [Desulfocucumis palustris]GBF35527.1 glucose-6-phosphate isomerase [Desulfocucumis palustris]